MSDGIKLFLAAITAMVVFVAVFITLGHAHEYEITGHNALTGDRVAGTMADTAHNGPVHGLILDRLDRASTERRVLAAEARIHEFVTAPTFPWFAVEARARREDRFDWSTWATIMSMHDYHYAEDTGC